MLNSKDYSPISILHTIRKNRQLIIQLTKRDITDRYKGSFLGMFWALLNPIIMLVIYTYFFGLVLKSRWDTSTSANTTEFAIVLFCGIIAFSLFSEIVTRAPGLILGNSSYVKKVIFPLEILPIVSLLSALTHMLISCIILLLGIIFFIGNISWTIIFFPLVILPIILSSLGFSWFFASLGVFVRDIGQVLSLAIQGLMFLSPIFYPVSIIPDQFKWIYMINPIGYVVEDVRNVLIWGNLPNWNWLFIGIVISSLITYLGYIWFQKTRGGFSDVL
ncbi:hypothetical protein PAESOLCIP111_06726 [Paenibacillus solanacearum]|uniref:Transport permease protein n=1 Tax=Paenibacillus solanacearum TaxID=2048548 RepID=A0A916KAL8_9BACL|nr:ABC transporter permease [Paenibacillus solanacearum]CAG7653241.1 hypothetical protein PAESOLCIP111_06726 [Paenibacillus solanacearum]